MLGKLSILGALVGATLSASPIQITFNLTGGTFDRGLTTGGVDTGTGFTTSLASCVGAGCVDFGSTIADLDANTFAFTVPSGSLTGAGSVVSGTITLPQNVAGLTFKGESAFDQNSTLTENIAATGILGFSDALTGTVVLNWSGNASVQAKPATGTVTLIGDLATAVPEPSTAWMLSLAIAGLFGARFMRRRTISVQ